MLNGYGAASPAPASPGAVSPNYSYANALAPAVPVHTPMAGVASIADALINGYFNQPSASSPASASAHAPQQLQGGAPNSFLSAIFGAAPGGVTPSPSTTGGLY